MNEEYLYCDKCGENFDNAFEMVDHYLEDEDEFNPAIILPNGVRLLIGSLLRFIFRDADEPEKIKQITQSTYIALYAAESNNEFLNEIIEEIIVDSEMLDFDSSLKTLLDEGKPNETNESGA